MSIPVVVILQELLGHDSSLLRTYIHVGNEILSHRNNAVTGTMDKKREQLKKNEQYVGEFAVGRWGGGVVKYIWLVSYDFHYVSEILSTFILFNNLKHMWETVFLNKLLYGS